MRSNNKLAVLFLALIFIIGAAGLAAALQIIPPIAPSTHAYSGGITYEAASGLYLAVNSAEASWDAYGIRLTSLTAVSTRTATEIVGDGSGGALAAYVEEGATGVATGSNVVITRVSSSGAKTFITGVRFSGDVSGTATETNLTGDGGGGAFVVWLDGRTSTTEVYFARVNSSGTLVTSLDGVRVTSSDNTGSMSHPQVTADGSGGAVITWKNQTSIPPSTYFGVQAQRVDASGNRLWGSNGVAVSPIETTQRGRAEIVVLGSRVYVFYDNGTLLGQCLDLSTGASLWGGELSIASNVINSSDDFGAAVDTSAGTIYLSWNASNESNQTQSLVQKINSSGLAWASAQAAPFLGYSTVHRGIDVLSNGNVVMCMYTGTPNGALWQVDSSGNTVSTTEVTGFAPLQVSSDGSSFYTRGITSSRQVGAITQYLVEFRKYNQNGSQLFGTIAKPSGYIIAGTSSSNTNHFIRGGSAGKLIFDWFKADDSMAYINQLSDQNAVSGTVEVQATIEAGLSFPIQANATGEATWESDAAISYLVTSDASSITSFANASSIALNETFNLYGPNVGVRVSEAASSDRSKTPTQSSLVVNLGSSVATTTTTTSTITTTTTLPTAPITELKINKAQPKPGGGATLNLSFNLNQGNQEVIVQIWNATLDTLIAEKKVSGTLGGNVLDLFSDISKGTLVSGETYRVIIRAGGSLRSLSFVYLQ